MNYEFSIMNSFLIIFIINIRLQQSRHAMCIVWLHIDICCCGRDEAGVTFGQCHSHTSSGDGAVAFETHIYNKGVVLVELAMEGAIDLEQFDDEELIDDEWHRIIEFVLIVGAIDVNVGHLASQERLGSHGGKRTLTESGLLARDVEVNRIERLLSMQLTWLAIETRTVIVEDSVSHIGALLHLGQQDASTDGMDAARWDEEDIACLDGMLGQHLADRAIGHTVLILVA